MDRGSGTEKEGREKKSYCGQWQKLCPPKQRPALQRHIVEIGVGVGQLGMGVGRIWGKWVNFCIMLDLINLRWGQVHATGAQRGQS